MNIVYRKTKEFDLESLKELYLSVGWKLGNNPHKLQISMKSSHNVFSAWDGNKLVGIINCLSDGIATVYFNNLLVNPEYQGKGIGSTLINMTLEEYKEYNKKILIAEKGKIAFYEALGFKTGYDVVPMSYM
ncbi:GNAT family N-acetyltransferase [Clostridium sp. YIM B02515]|uniref:GNAT family N-acetyltransferase n=1 Tax=Clostridium rhizosphaerae TaxID=2803861 RepID=A0ABS1TC64_9CLOT|nr:GNAT family N-acetyltransferase [Clostridium rhizosphaerae]MBL4936959.1 GNAT family N-acetyltransferase [Clostridium rhizosphaerae]